MNAQFLNDFLPQYAAQCAADFDLVCKKGKKEGRHNDRMFKLYQDLSDTLKNCVHIVLPQNGEIYRSNSAAEREPPTADEIESLLGLPAPVCCFEYPWSYDQGLSLEEIAPKRITIVADAKQVYETQASGVAFISAAYMKKHNQWLVIPEAAVCLLDPIKFEKTDRGWKTAAYIKMLCGDDSDDRKEKAMSDIFQDITAVTQCCHALRAGATLRERTEKSSFRRYKMTKKGVGDFVYHVLELPSHISDQSATPQGTHASPRLHIRRAHIRKLPTGVLTFVKQCFVGDASIGVVKKYYEINNSRK